MQIELLGQNQLQDIKRLVFQYPFNIYRFYRKVNKEKLKEYLFHQINEEYTNNKKNVIAVQYENGEIVGLATYNFLEWDSDHFGFKLAKVGYLMSEAAHTTALPVKESLLKFLIEYSQKENISHLTCRVDANDLSSIHALESNGFQLMDTIVTYIFKCRVHKILELKDYCQIRYFQEKDLGPLKEMAKQAFSRDRFHLDSSFTKAQSDDLHAKWIKSFSTARDIAQFFVAEINHKPVGFLVGRLNEPLQQITGVSVVGLGLNAVLPKVKGVYPSLLKATLEYSEPRYDFVEFDSQVNNYEIIKIWRRFGLDFLRAQYTFRMKL